MNAILDSAPRSLLTGLAIALLILVLWIALSGVDAIGLTSFLLRWIHILGGILWLGMIFFVNFIQFAALAEADEAGRSAIMKLIVPRVAHSLKHAAGLTLLTGVLLLVTSGYLFDSLVFSSAVYIPPLRNTLLWAGVAGGVTMWAFVEFIIGPNLRIVLGQTRADAAGIARARRQAKTFARLNLILAVPVTFVMVAAAHLY